jgi:hypothetical protein
MENGKWKIKNKSFIFHFPFLRIMKRIIILTIALLLAAATNSFAQSKLEQEFIERHRAEEEAEAKRDVAALERLFADDFIFVAANGALYDKKKFIDEIKAETDAGAP